MVGRALLGLLGQVTPAAHTHLGPRGTPGMDKMRTTLASGLSGTCGKGVWCGAARPMVSQAEGHLSGAWPGLA